MIRRLSLIVALAAVIFAALPAQAGTLYAVANNTGGNDTLYSIDTATPTVATAVGPLGTPFTAYAFGGLAYAAELDTLFMVHRDSEDLFSINRTTGAATVVGAHGLGTASGGLFGLAYDPNNDVLWALRQSPTRKLYKLDPGSGAATFVANLSPNTGIDGLAYDTTLGRLVGSVGSFRKLFEINTTTGGVTLIDGTYTDPTGNYNNSGLAYDKDDDVFWSVESHVSYGGTAAKLVVHDLAGGGTHTEYVIASGIVGLQAIDDLAYVPDVTPVPEPGSLALIAGGAAALGFVRRRRIREGVKKFYTSRKAGKWLCAINSLDYWHWQISHPLTTVNFFYTPSPAPRTRFRLGRKS